MSTRFLWRSEEKVINVVSPQPVELVSTQQYVGSNGGRVMIDMLYLRIRGTVTVATAAWDGRDVPGLISVLTVEMNDGTPRVMPISGVAHRLATMLQIGPDRYNEHPTVAIGAAQAVDLRLPIVFVRPWQRRPQDYSLGAELLKRVLFTPATLAAAATATTALSAGTFTASLEVWGHEESDVVHSCLDTWSVIDFTSTNQALIQLPGPLQELYIVSTAVSAAARAGGGGLITGINTVRIDQLQVPPLERATALAQYRFARCRGNTGTTAVAAEWLSDPVTEGRIFPVEPVSDDLLSPWEGFTTKGGPLKVDIDPATASMQLLARCAQPRTKAAWDLTNAAFNIGSAQIGAVKTQSGAPADFSKGELPYTPLKFSLPQQSKRF